ncbi:hypothetical protein PDESU_02760 [Pontiella desulfatans]|uniref:Transglycosylase associated protein n=1 Tax=Pontiella desulfatans TaxID=2750659 RepID=A0A6C2U3S9_PONDE|nr:GlsB/YeaQ/YmgE family stress response membrane protein [Pontiella desulfatans]VGO14201.1 hypothetical protein PDESU_02760 [Pontiella desulfatans]
MEIQELVILIATGAIAGWLASLIVRKGGFNIFGNIIIGVIGAYIGTALFQTLGIRFANPHLGLLAMSTIGAIILLILMGFLMKFMTKK